MNVVARDEVTEAEMARFSSDIATALRIDPITLNGQLVELVDGPEFVYNDGTSTRKCKLIN